LNNSSFHLISLGCAKNTVDSESMASILKNSGYSHVSDPKKAEVIIVNTCGFIQLARQEALDTLQELADEKEEGQLLIAAGCLTERYREEVIQQVPGIDGILGSRRWMDIVDVVKQLRRIHPRTLYHLPDSPTIGKDEHGVLRAAIQGASAYLKIADGCRRPCAFCAIPLIKGTTVSRPMNTILKEAQTLENMGLKELILIAQDTTDYGYDLGIKDGLATLLERMVSEIPQIPWIRILYAFPGFITDRLIQAMADNPQILPYLDVPLQHANQNTLRRMRRPANMDAVHQTIEKVRTIIPDITLRTTFIVGYPGETEAEFQELLDFVSEIKFDHLGAFTFSFEPGTYSEPLGDPIPGEVKQARMEKLMTLQENISLSNNQAYIGKTLPTLIEGQDQGISIGRTYRDAPEIDGLMIIEDKAPVGEIIPIQITGALSHDLIGKII
jgi:ribosomal protein S12 methylthiotransferase